MYIKCVCAHVPFLLSTLPPVQLYGAKALWRHLSLSIHLSRRAGDGKTKSRLGKQPWLGSCQGLALLLPAAVELSPPWPGLAWPGLAWPGLAWPGLPSPVVVFVRPTLFPLEEKELETDYYYYLLREEYTTSKRPYPPPGGGPSQKISFWAEEISLRACPPKSQNDRQALLESLSTALLPLPSPARKTEKSQAEPCFPEGQVRINARAYTNAYTRT